MLLSTLCLAFLPAVWGAATSQTVFAEGDEVHKLAGWEYSDCGSSNDVVILKSLEISPDPPQPGKNLTVTVAGTAQRPINEGAYADVTVKLGLIKLLHKEVNLCEEARKANVSVQCPVQEGDYVVTHTVELPKEIPPAKFTVNIRAYNDDDEDLACMDIKADFMRKPGGGRFF